MPRQLIAAATQMDAMPTPTSERLVRAEALVGLVVGYILGHVSRD